MFIRKTTHTVPKTGQKYHTYKLVESIRTERGPRQHTILNLGAHFSLPKENWQELANRIEAIISGQKDLFPVSEEIEQYAQMYAQRIIRRIGKRDPQPIKEQKEKDFHSVDINTLENEQVRSVGGESVVLETIKELKLDQKLEELGFNQSNIEAAIGVITARLLNPGSERATHIWLINNTSLDDLLGTSFEPLSQDRVYKVSDRLLKFKDEIEMHLSNQERHLFNLDENILLYDLTNTFFEGSGRYNAKAHFGVSKEKRTDCPLVTLGLVLDGDGFPKRSKVLEGNISEPGTLQRVLSGISTKSERPVVVVDAGIGTEENIKWMIENGYCYIVVSRRKKRELISRDEMVVVRENDQRVVKAAIRKTDTGEIEVHCHSSAREIKERGIKNRFERRFEDQLSNARKALSKKYGTKKYDKVVEKIGRLKERYRRVSRRYEIIVEKDETTGKAIDIKWWMKPIDDTSGYYILRTNLKNTDEKRIFDTFTMLLEVEDSFRSMKSDLGLRPIYHQTEFRCDGHLFITVLAYHVLQSIRVRLRNKGLFLSWSTIRSILSTHFRVTTSMRRSDGKMIYIRKTAKPEGCHTRIYDALNLPHRPGGVSKIIL